MNGAFRAASTSTPSASWLNLIGFAQLTNTRLRQGSLTTLAALVDGIDA